MKLIILFFALIATLSSCTITRINVYGNGNYINTPCTVNSENRCFNYEGVEIVVRGSTCDYVAFLNAEQDRNVLLSLGYIMTVENDIVYFTHSKFY